MSTSQIEAVHSLAGPLTEAAGATIYDITMSGGKLVVMVERDGGIDLDALADISRELGRQLDERELIGGSYTLEVTSPGLERPLRTQSHFAGAVGETVTIRVRVPGDGAHRVRGELTAAGDTDCTVVIDEAAGTHAIGDTVTVAYDRVDKARTIFTWGNAPANNPSSKKKPQKKKA